jgi:hypothetical protein
MWLRENAFRFHNSIESQHGFPFDLMTVRVNALSQKPQSVAMCSKIAQQAAFLRQSKTEDYVRTPLFPLSALALSMFGVNSFVLLC